MAQKILVVDDDPGILKWARSLLGKNKYEVSEAENGTEALLKLKKETPDLIILDIILPDIDGYQVCNRIRADARYAGIPIIFLTVREKELDDKIIQRLNIAYIQKPASNEVLLETINNLLGKR